MSDIVDLDALAPEASIIKFDGEEIKVQPPKTGYVLKLGTFGQQLEKIDDLTEEQVDKLVSELTNHIYKMIPELKDKPLTTSQLLRLIQIITAMTIPPEAKALKARGITVDSPKVP